MQRREGTTSESGRSLDAAVVEQRVYAALRARSGTSPADARLCAKLASLAERLYRQRALDDADLAEMLHHLDS